MGTNINAIIALMTRMKRLNMWGKSPKLDHRNFYSIDLCTNECTNRPLGGHRRASVGVSTVLTNVVARSVSRTAWVPATG